MQSQKSQIKIEADQTIENNGPFLIRFDSRARKPLYFPIFKRGNEENLKSICVKCEEGQGEDENIERREWPRERKRSQGNCECRKLVDQWSVEEKGKFVAYFIFNRRLLEQSKNGNLWPFFQQMSQFIKTRNFRQCRNYFNRLLSQNNHYKPPKNTQILQTVIQIYNKLCQKIKNFKQIVQKQLESLQKETYTKPWLISHNPHVSSLNSEPQKHLQSIPQSAYLYPHLIFPCSLEQPHPSTPYCQSFPPSAPYSLSCIPSQNTYSLPLSLNKSSIGSISMPLLMPIPIQMPMQMQMQMQMPISIPVSMPASGQPTSMRDMGLQNVNMQQMQQIQQQWLECHQIFIQWANKIKELSQLCNL